MEPIEINTFGLDLTAIPPGNGYVIYVSDASGNDYSFGGVDDNFTPPFDIISPQEQLQLVLDYDAQNQEINFYTNSDAYSFTWFFNGSPDASLQTQEISVIQSGLYGVSISDEYGCSIYADTLVQMIGVEELFIESFEVYPNPTDGLVSIHYDLPSKSPSTLRIISLLGELIYEMEFEESKRVEAKLDLFDLSAGVYLVELDLDGEKIHRRLSVK